MPSRIKIILNQSYIFAYKVLVTLQTAKQAYCEDDGEVSRILGVPTLLMQVELAPALHLVEHVAVPGLTPRVPATIEAPDKRARWQHVGELAEERSPVIKVEEDGVGHAAQVLCRCEAWGLRLERASRSVPSTKLTGL